ncbi:imidazolonepropionase [Marinomonas mediterranea]|uniref:imidazolonepropionase n=1 Tax=Marinomonas mediterranea TaxID=119864 RepID=UPI00234953A3|nr:imidazolonepropionase [Marinomonas mediterranea]WCN10730.1 imidazolonepropionase [Marinomonas mediterranea]WCN14786.1 imidazolonepropionase [Marinomonas mediterranea]
MPTNSLQPRHCDSLWYGMNIATMENGQYSVIEDAAMAVLDGKIDWVGKRSDLPNYQADQEMDLEGGWITPGLVDCHTHIVFGGNRANEFEMRLNGANYEDIAKAGGGIISSVRDTRNATLSELTESAQRRLESLMADGVTSVEIKSGYGLNTASEVAMLQAARSLEGLNAVDIKTTCLAAHALPPEFKDNADGYIDYLCDEVLPEIAELGLADAVDAFCEGIGFSPAQVTRYFECAASLGLPVKLHAEQLSSLGGSSLAAKYKALSADHLEYATEEDIVAMSASGTVAVILPGAFYVLKETQKPPINWFRKHNVPMAIATDANPGTSPALSLRLMMNMACTLFAMTPEEALAGVTIHAAKALDIDHQVGSIEIGKQANFVHWQIDSPAELSYWLGGNLVKHRVYNGIIS